MASFWWFHGDFTGQCENHGRIWDLMVIWDDLIDGDLMMRMIFNFHDFMGFKMIQGWLNGNSFGFKWIQWG